MTFDFNALLDSEWSRDIRTLAATPARTALNADLVERIVDIFDHTILGPPVPDETVSSISAALYEPEPEELPDVLIARLTIGDDTRYYRADGRTSCALHKAVAPWNYDCNEKRQHEALAAALITDLGLSPAGLA